MDTNAARRLRGCGLIALAALFWALSGIVAKHLFTTRTIAPLVLVEFRMLIAFGILLLLLAALAPSTLRIRLRDLPFFLVYGSLGMAMVQLTYFTAIREGSVSTAIFLQYLAPLLTATYSVVWLRQPAPAGLGRHLALALGGSAMLLLGAGGLTTTPLGVLAGLASAGLLSFYAVYGARGVGMYSSHTVLLYALAVGTVSLWPLFTPWQVASLGWGATDWLFAIYMAVFGTLVPFTLFLAGLRYVTPVQATLTAMLEPVLATVGAWLILGEALSPWQIAGCCLIAVAVARLQLTRQAGAGAD
jgi:drug/metabolite transporter (DMT)-like permease